VSLVQLLFLLSHGTHAEKQELPHRREVFALNAVAILPFANRFIALIDAGSFSFSGAA
jgi:hypothetical protein